MSPDAHRRGLAGSIRQTPPGLILVEISLYAVDLGHKAGLGLLCTDETCRLQRLGQGLASLRFQGKLLAGAICIANRKCSMDLLPAAVRMLRR